MSALTFQPWPKTPRLYRDVTITEKIDGTNAAVHVVALADIGDSWDGSGTTVALPDDGRFIVGAQSRNRLITPEADNYGFAAWVQANAYFLATILGPGVHYGEWWGHGIQRGYGLPRGERRFSLFNVARYTALGADYPYLDHLATASAIGLHLVPVLYSGPFSDADVRWAISELAHSGSHAAPGFASPEGVVVYHEAARQVFKVLIEHDDRPKGAA